MPAVSKQQQKLFGLVHAYQTGKVSPDKISDKIKRIAKSISPEDAKKFASTAHVDIKELQSVFKSPAYVQETLQEIVSTGTPEYVKGVVVDKYTASMLLKAATHLNENNKNKLFSHSLNEMVAISYKILTY